MTPVRIVTVEADWLEKLVKGYQAAVDKLIESQRQLANKQHDELMTLGEVALLPGSRATRYVNE